MSYNEIPLKKEELLVLYKNGIQYTINLNAIGYRENIEGKISGITIFNFPQMAYKIGNETVVVGLKGEFIDSKGNKYNFLDDGGVTITTPNNTSKTVVLTQPSSNNENSLLMFGRNSYYTDEFYKDGFVISSVKIPYQDIISGTAYQTVGWTNQNIEDAYSITDTEYKNAVENYGWGRVWTIAEYGSISYNNICQMAAALWQTSGNLQLFAQGIPFFWGDISTNRAYINSDTLSGFLNPIIDNPDDPYEPGGSSETGGGNGTFDETSDNIDFPSLPTINALQTGFISMWRPTIIQLTNLYNYMWSNAFDIDSFKKIFANPIDVILGFAICPLNPVISGATNFKVGNIDTGIAIDKISEQYYTIDCGTINIEEFFGSYLDYEPYTTLDLFLPYIGSVRMSVDDIRENGTGSIHIKYNVDILSGSCVAMVKCINNRINTLCYQYNGSVLTQLPITGNDFTSMYQSVISLAGNVIGGITSGIKGNAGAVLGNVANAAGNVISAKPTINRSGNITSASGLMAEQKPFLILNMPKQAVAFAENLYYGYPSHITQGIASITGYAEFEKVYLDGIPATESEINEIQNILLSGVYL